MKTLRWAAPPVILALAACAAPNGPAPMPSALAEKTPTAMACPKEAPADARCLGGQDSAGAFYLIAMPKVWNGHLVLHAHGGPALGPPTLKRAEDDLNRWAVTVRAGYAWAGSSFRQGGVAVRAAAEDTERLRGIFIQHVAHPKRTLLHGQSWGAGVAAKGAEMFTRETVWSAGGKPPYDAVLLTSGVLGGGTHSYDFRLDLRVVYQYLCNNHPRPDEPAYPLWQGLPANSKLNQAQLRERTRECLGLGLPAAQRTPEQARKLKTLVDVIGIRESSVQGHLNWGTFHFADIAQRSGDKNVFGNIGAVYRGSGDDTALNAGVSRYRANPQAVARFAADTDPTGRIPVPVLTVHAVNDPIAFVELESRFKQVMTAAGTADHLVQTFTDDSEHSYLSDPVYPAALEALLKWVESGSRPTPQTVAQRCVQLQADFGSGCRFVPDYKPAALDARVVPRERP